MPVATATDRTPQLDRRPRVKRSGVTLLAVVLLAITAAGCMPPDARTFLDRTNSLRGAVGVGPLQENDVLTEKAEAWAQHMARTGRLEHSDLTDGLGSLPWRRLGENVGYSNRTSDTLLSIHKAFVQSPLHKANLVDGRFTHMGVGVAEDSQGRIWVAEVFAQL